MPAIRLQRCAMTLRTRRRRLAKRTHRVYPTLGPRPRHHNKALHVRLQARIHVHTTFFRSCACRCRCQSICQHDGKSAIDANGHASRHEQSKYDVKYGKRLAHTFERTVQMGGGPSATAGGSTMSSNMLSQLTNPTVIAQATNPRVQAALRQIHEALNVLRAEAPDLLAYVCAATCTTNVCRYPDRHKHCRKACLIPPAHRSHPLRRRRI